MNGNVTNGQADRFFDAAANLMNAAAHAARGPSVLVLDTTGTGIPTVETHDGLRWGCKIVQRGDGLFDVVSACGVFYLGGGLWYTLPSDPIDVGVFDDEHDAAKWLSDTKYAPPSWYAAELARVQAQRDALAEAPADTDAPGAKDGPLARITPEADEQVDGKGRTLVEIDAALEDVFEELASYARRTENLERLLAARVAKPCEPSKATGQNELASAVEAADWREALQTRGYSWGGCWLYTPCGGYWWSGHTRNWYAVEDGDDRTKCDDDQTTSEQRRTCTEPPNLREWWPVKADTCDGLEVANATNDLLIKERDTLRRQHATAQSDLLSMTAQRDNAVRRATAAEQALADARAEIERLRNDGN